MVDTVLVAFCVTHTDYEGQAQIELMKRLPPGDSALIEGDEDGPWIDSWWIADDDRLDGSDCDSAVFVPEHYGVSLTQDQAYRLIKGIIPEHSDAGPATHRHLERAIRVLGFYLEPGGDDGTGWPTDEEVAEARNVLIEMHEALTTRHDRTLSTKPLSRRTLATDSRFRLREIEQANEN